ncbi:MAG: hypothetical protein QNJ90_12410 [Planctomycetota bacterium]|nr:hypothetical protein [Planctomycetota bacterium]
MDVSLADLWLPILLSGVAVFFLSFIMWMVLPHHRSDWSKLPDEDGTMDHLGDIEAGMYTFPHCVTPEEMKDPAYIEKRDKGPSGMMTIVPRGPMNMGKSMFLSFIYNVIIAVLVAYVATIAIAKGDPNGDVLQLTSTVAWLGFAGAHGWYLLWFYYKPALIAKSVIDGLVYALACGFLFKAFWPGV